MVLEVEGLGWFRRLEGGGWRLEVGGGRLEVEGWCGIGSAWIRPPKTAPFVHFWLT